MVVNKLKKLKKQRDEARIQAIAYSCEYHYMEQLAANFICPFCRGQREHLNSCVYVYWENAKNDTAE